MYQFVIASAAMLLGCAVAASGWSMLPTTSEPTVAANGALSLVDEAYLSLLLVCR